MNIIRVKFDNEDDFNVARVHYQSGYKAFKDSLHSKIKHIVEDNWVNLAFVINTRSLMVNVRKELSNDERQEVSRILSETLRLRPT